jgi:hypothetical protein
VVTEFAAVVENYICLDFFIATHHVVLPRIASEKA